MHIPNFKMFTNQQGDDAFSIDFKDAYLPIPIFKHHNSHFVWENKPNQRKVLQFGMAMVLRVFTLLTKSILFLCQCKGFVLLYIWIISWS